MAKLTVQTVNEAGAVVTLAAATATVGDTVSTAGGETVVRINNGGASSITVTVAAQSPCSHGALHNLSITVAAGAMKDIYIPAYCAAAADGLATVICSAVTSVTIGAYKVSLRK